MVPDLIVETETVTNTKYTSIFYWQNILQLIYI